MAWLDRLTTMMKMIPILLAATLGCASEVELPLDLDRGVPPAPDESDPPSDLPPPANDWSSTDFPVQGQIQDLVWTTDGAVVAATPITGDLDSRSDLVPVTLTRYGADGAIEWVAHAGPTDLFMELAAIEGGGVVVGIRPDLTSASPAPAGLAWYGAEGGLTASWRPSAGETGEQLVAITSVRPLPGGGVFWVGWAGLTNAAPVAGLLDAARQLEWIVPLPAPAQTVVRGRTHAALTADGGFVVLASSEPVEPEWPEEPELGASPEAYLVQLGPDGGERWLTELEGAGAGVGIRAASSGDLIVAGTYTGTMSVGDLVLEDGPAPARHFVAAIDPAGEPRTLHRMEIPAWLVGEESRFRIHAMTMTGDDLMVAGDFFADTIPLVQAGFIAMTYRLDGGFVSDSVIALHDQAVEGDGGGVGPMALDVAPDGRAATGGAFSGSVDFGDGFVDSGVGGNGAHLTLPFVAVFESADADVD